MNRTNSAIAIRLKLRQTPSILFYLNRLGILRRMRPDDVGLGRLYSINFIFCLLALQDFRRITPCAADLQKMFLPISLRQKHFSSPSICYTEIEVIT